MILKDGTLRDRGPDTMREAMLETLDDLYHQSRHMLARTTVTLEDARKLSSYITGVRTLLAELADIEGRKPGGVKAAEAIRDMKDRYWELEGMVKEARNSLDRNIRRP